jgi:hypothetical protein
MQISNDAKLNMTNGACNTSCYIFFKYVPYKLNDYPFLKFNIFLDLDIYCKNVTNSLVESL